MPAKHLTDAFVRNVKLPNKHDRPNQIMYLDTTERGWALRNARTNSTNCCRKTWTLGVIHDLRRTARSLMSRAGVRPDLAERVMGHAIAGVEGVYDRHSYTDEKADALKRLAGLIEQIINPAPANVPMLKPRR